MKQLQRFGPEWWVFYAQAWGPDATRLLRSGCQKRMKDGSSETVKLDRAAFVKAAIRDADEAIEAFNATIDQI